MMVNFSRFCLLCSQNFGHKANKNGTKEQSNNKNAEKPGSPSGHGLPCRARFRVRFSTLPGRMSRLRAPFPWRRSCSIRVDIHFSVGGGSGSRRGAVGGTPSPIRIHQGRIKRRRHPRPRFDQSRQQFGSLSGHLCRRPRRALPTAATVPSHAPYPTCPIHPQAPCESTRVLP